LLLAFGPVRAAHAATTTTIQVAPCEVPDEQQPRVNPGDAPAGFGPDSWQGPASGKSNWYAGYGADGDKLTALFPADAATLTIADLASISYFTKRPAATPATRDWWIQIYTRPTLSGDKASWYHDRYINNYGDHTETDAWTQYSTASGMTFQSNGWGGPVMSLADLITAHGGELIGAISIQTDSGWAGFGGYVDGLEITLTNGNVGRVNLGSALSADDRYVDDTGGIDGPNNCLTQTVPCATIQRAVNVACAGGTVHVAEGTYAEQLTIGTNNLTVVGTNAVIKPTIVVANSSSPCSGAAQAAIILVQDGTTGVALNNLVVDGSGAGASGPARYTGIFYRNASGQVSGGEVRYIEDIPFSGAQRGNAIIVQAKAPGTANVNVTGVSVHDFQKGGIVYNGCGCSSAVDGAPTGTISGNTVSGVGSTASIAQNGIQVGFGAGPVTITANHVSFAAYSGAGWTSSGILLYSSNNNTVTGNVVSSAQEGIVLQAGACPGDGTNGNSISSNTISGNVGNVGAFYAGLDIEGDSNTVTMNNVSDYHNSDTGGLFLYGSANTVTCNETTLNDIGIETLKPSSGSGVNTIANNSIHGNTIGMRNDDSPGFVVNATGNYWGKFDGPDAGPGTGSGDPVGDGITFEPFLASVPTCVNCTDDSQCDDGLTCNLANTAEQTETCNLSTHMCVQHPVPCSLGGADPQCNTPVCTEPTGCAVPAQQPDGTPCNTGDSCQAGVCTGGTGSLMVATARLKRSTATNPRFYNGSVFVQAVIIDEDTGGALPGNLVGGGVTLDVQDGSGNFYPTQPIVSLSSCAQNRAGTLVSCKGDSGSKTKATFKKIRYFGHPYGSVWKMTLHRTGLATGSGVPTGPFQVTLHQGPVDRSDNPSVCSSLGANTVVCHHSS
jgi:parallel beta-helix repeat protein